MSAIVPTALGVDVGGTEVKAGVVDLRRGKLVGPRRALRTPRPATPQAVGRTIRQLVEQLNHRGPVGITYPGAIVEGKAQTAANMDPGWLGIPVGELIGGELRQSVAILNDADAAGLAESWYGAGRGHDGLMITVTFGTGIGTALINQGRLVPNAELGHLEIDGKDAETFAAAAAIQRDDLSWSDWAARANRYLNVLEKLLWPSLIVIGGGISTSPERWLPLLKTRARIAPAHLSNSAGIVGAALTAGIQTAGPLQSPPVT
jgi:polyphosphate glucokinase